MFEMISRIFMLAGDKKKTLVIATVLNILQNFCIGGIYIIVLMALVKLVEGTFGSEDLWNYSLGMVGLFFLRYVLEYFVTTLQSTIGYEIMSQVRIKESERLTKLPLGVFQSESLGTLSSVFTNDMGFIEQRCMAIASNFIAGLASFFCLSVLMFFMDFSLTLIAMSGFIPAFFVYKLIKARLKITGKKRHDMEENIIGTILEYVSGMETIRSYRMNDHVFKDITNHLKDYREAVIEDEITGLPTILLYLLFIRVGMGLIFLCGLTFYLHGMLSLPVFLFFAMISGTYYKPLEALISEFGVLNRIALSLDRIQNLHSLPILTDDGRIKPKGYDICLHDVTFSYKSGETPALNAVNAIFKSGTLTALVGHSGSGKTSLLMLLSRFWDVQSGKITIDGLDIRDISQRELMQSFSMVFQDVYLFAGSLEDNIRMGKSSASTDEVIAVAQAAGCHDFIMTLPEGYATLVGEGGCTLSGGEQQRVSIARAILKDAPIILLDEAFSSVDPENARSIQQALSVLTHQKTVIMIAHTLNHIRHANQILVMDSGKVIENGNHETLLENGGHYKQLWDKEVSVKSWKLTSTTSVK